MDKEKVTVTMGQQVCSTTGFFRFRLSCGWHKTRKWRLDIVWVIVIITVKSIDPLAKGGFYFIVQEVY